MRGKGDGGRERERGCLSHWEDSNLDPEGSCVETDDCVHHQRHSPPQRGRLISSLTLWRAPGWHTFRKSVFIQEQFIQ